MKKNKKKDIKKKEKLFSICIAIIFIVLLILAINNNAFLPACLITLGLEFFSICYYYMDDKDKKVLVYCLFGVSVSLILFAIIYTFSKVL